tara:strand:- start:161 stop:514 length:354 start_codon:yes stop_codon:yes gene_type:complete
MVNKIIIIGNLGQDPEAPRKTQTGKSVMDISIATKRRGQQEATDWHTVTCWGNTADAVYKYLKKGRQVYVEGRLQYDTWEDDEGKTKKKAKVVADTVQFLGRKDESGMQNTSDGIPF